MSHRYGISAYASARKKISLNHHDLSKLSVFVVVVVLFCFFVFLAEVQTSLL